MNLLIVRHAIAEDKEQFVKTGRPDTERPLTEEGERKMRRAAKGLRKEVRKLDVLATSPLTRAAETAAILFETYGSPKPTTIDALAPDAPLSKLIEWLRKQKADATVAVVGHEPHLGRFVSYLLSGQELDFCELKKGGACMIEIDGSPTPGKARLQFTLVPRQLRGLS